MEDNKDTALIVSDVMELLTDKRMMYGNAKVSVLVDGQVKTIHRTDCSLPFTKTKSIVIGEAK